MNKVAWHRELCMGLNKTYEAKNRDYGDSFHLSFVEEGPAMARIRLTDKLNRFKTLTRSPESQSVNDESIIDTLLDLANYAIMTVMELDKEKPDAERDESASSSKPPKPVCRVNYKEHEVNIMYDGEGYFVDSPHCTICDLCMFGDNFPDDTAACMACRHHAGDSERFNPKV